MTTLPKALRELADRVEGLTGPDREVDAEIAAAVRYFPKGVGFVWQHALKPNSPESGRVECCTSLGTGGPHYAALRYSASLDAAMSLADEDTAAQALREAFSLVQVMGWSRDHFAGTLTRYTVAEILRALANQGAAE